jgi:hypothetical protein
VSACPKCSGQGFTVTREPNKLITDQCQACRGTGERTIRPTRRSPVLPGPQPLKVYVPNQIQRQNWIEQTDWKLPEVQSGKRWRN